MTDPRTVTIAGGGLAGLSLGIGLRRFGIPVKVIEAGSYPRHRVCGEFISGVTDTELAALGIPTILGSAIPNITTSWFVEGRCFLESELPSPAMGISRHMLDEELARRFEVAGGILETGQRYIPNGEESTEGTVFAIGRPRRTGSDWIGLKCHLRDFPLHANLEMHLGDEGYLGISRIENGLANACGLFRVRRGIKAAKTELLIAYLDSCGLTQLADRIRKARVMPESCLGVSAFELGHQHKDAATSDHLCLGDQFAIIGPFTGNGMSMAFQSAALALKPVVSYARRELDWISCREETTSALRRNFSKRLAVSRILHPFLTESLGQKILVQLGQKHILPFSMLFRMLR